MGKIRDKAYFFYEGFRKYVPKKKLADYDNEFFNRKSYNVKFVVQFIEKYVNLSYYHKNLKDDNDAYLFNHFVIEFSQLNSKTDKAFKEFKNTRSHLDTNFLFKNSK